MMIIITEPFLVQRVLETIVLVNFGLNDTTVIM